MKKIFILILSVMSISNAQIKLAGEQDGVFDSGTYVVSRDLIVPEGKKLDFLPNVRLLFMPYVGIKVFGQLKMRNAKLSPQDSMGNWNGIEVAQKGKIDFKNVTISRSVMGIGVPDSTAIQLFDNVTFEANKSALRIAEIPIFVREGKPFTFTKGDFSDLEKEKPRYTSDRLFNTDNENKSHILAGKWISAVTAITCIAAGIYSVDASNRKYTEYKKATGQKDIQSYKNQCLMYRNIAIGTGIGAGVAGMAFGVCFIIDAKKD